MLYRAVRRTPYIYSKNGHTYSTKVFSLPYSLYYLFSSRNILEQYIKVLFYTSIYISLFVYTNQCKWHLTYQVGDVPAHLIEQTEGLRWAGMWVRENRTKALSADCGFSNPEGAISARSANRLLCDRTTLFHI
jgi:hypothetical protein